jgi:type II secretory pathway component HofQ
MLIGATMRTLLIGIVCLIPATLIAAPIQDSKGSGETPVEKNRKALQQKITIEIADKTLEQAVTELKDLTKINFTLDRQALAGIGVMQFPQAFPGGVPPGFNPGQPAGNVSLKVKDVKVRDALKQLLAGENLTYVILADSVLITTEPMAAHHQLKQHVSLDLDAVPFKQAVKQLARETGANLIVDSKLAKEADAAVTLQIEDVPLETALRLLAEAAGLKPVRLGNVIYLTTKANANELRSEPDLSGQGQGPQMTPQQEWQLKMQQFGGWGVGGGIALPTPVAPPVAPAPPAPPDEKKEGDK